MRFLDPRTADEAGDVPVVGAEPAVLFDFLFGRRVDDAKIRLDNDVGYERVVDGVAEAYVRTVSDLKWYRMQVQCDQNESLTIECQRSGARRVSVNVEDFPCSSVGIQICDGGGSGAAFIQEYERDVVRLVDSF